MQVPPDSTGKKVDTTEITVGANVVDRQRVSIGDPTVGEPGATVAVAAPFGGTGGLVTRNIPYGPPLPAPNRDATPGQVMFVEDFANGITGMFNDGCGTASVDNNITFNGLPTVRLDPQGYSSTAGATGGTATLTLGGSQATYTVGGTGTLVGTSTGSAAPTVFGAGGYLVLTSKSGSACTTDGNTYVMTYADAVVGGSTGAWTVTFDGVGILNIPGTAATSCTTANIGSATFQANNPNPNGTGSPVTTGVVFKRRIDDQFSGTFGWSLWLRPTSKSSATSFTSVFCVSLYNRDGASAWLSRVMIQTAVGMTIGGIWSNDNQILWTLTGASNTQTGPTWVPFALLTNTAFNQHSWDPVSGSWDTAGGWHYVKIVTDFVTKTYVSVQFDGLIYTSMAGQSMYQIVGDTGAKLMHFSVEHAMAQSATRRFWNIARCVGTIEG